MDSKLRQVSQLLKRYDSDLTPRRFLDGRLIITRKRRDFDFYRFEEEGRKIILWFARDWEDTVLSCTHTWLETGHPVDWGIEPILSKIQETDSWRDDGDYGRFCKAREQRKSNRDRAFKNEIRARTMDLRRDFAKATNDINTSSLEKIERRRDKWQ